MTAQPSTSLYFTNACAGWLGRWWQRPAITRLGANSFAAGRWQVLVRRDRPALLRAALNRPGPLAWVIDDDLTSLTEANGLPAPYRERLLAFHAQWGEQLAARADALVVPSAALAERFIAQGVAPERIRLTAPCWAEPLADTSHFAPLAAGGQLKIVHLGSASHTGALARLVPAVLALLAGDPLAHFTYFAPRALCPRLESHPRARRLEPMRWAEYRRWLVRQRFHVALYPLGEDRFERARSPSKLVEHAIVGAVGVYPQGWAPARPLLSPAPPAPPMALAAPDDPGQWGPVLMALGGQRAALAGMARDTQEYLSAQRYYAKQRAFWHSLLGLGEG